MVRIRVGKQNLFKNMPLVPMFEFLFNIFEKNALHFKSGVEVGKSRGYFRKKSTPI